MTNYIISCCRLDSVKDSEEKVNVQFENARKKAKKVRTAFEKIKTDRYVVIFSFYYKHFIERSIMVSISSFYTFLNLSP